MFTDSQVRDIIRDVLLETFERLRPFGWSRYRFKTLVREVLMEL